MLCSLLAQGVGKRQKSSGSKEGWVLTNRWLICLAGAVLMLNGCAKTEMHLTAVQAPTLPPPSTPPPPQAQPVKTSAPIVPPAVTATVPDATDQLVKQVDALYVSGMSDYRAGNLEKSKQEFDQALATLLQSGLDIQGDDRLSSEFDKIVENVYSVEAASLEHGDALSLHNNEPTPLESFSGLTFPVDPRTKQRVQQELKSVHSDLPLVSNDSVDGVIAYLQNHARGYMENVLRRAGTYGEIIGEALRQQGVPQDLIYLAAGESAFNPLAVSNKQCVGIWQFSLGTGSLYGLKRDRWVDDRKDPFKSTFAAARHLKDLYQTFGDWFLVMAAYDSGPLTVQRAIEKTGYADYWELRRLHALPAETENYVPIFLATALIAKDPKAYGFDTQPDPPLSVDKVKVETPTDLRLVAQLIDHPVDDLIKLNPSLQRWTTPGNGSGFIMNLPAGTKDLYAQTIASIPPDKCIWWRAHKVLEGETLVSVARQFRVSPGALAQANQLTADASLEQGAHLVIPVAASSEASLARVREAVPHQLIHYRVRPGDTVDLIADRYDVTAYQIRRWNGLKTSKLVPGRTLHLYVEAQAHTAPRTSHPRPGAKSKHPSAGSATAQKKPAPSGNHTAPAAALASPQSPQ
jgi:membrane-bound lytic murein transglycosylase D